MSNLIKFYAIVDGVDPEQLITTYRGRLQSSTIPEDARKESIRNSLSIWDSGFPVVPGYNKWVPRYAPQNTLKTALGSEYGAFKSRYGEQTFPAYFQTYIPNEKGVFYQKSK